MYLDYWMIGVLIGVFGYALYDMYQRGYRKAYVSGGLYGHISTMEVVKSVISKEDLEKVREALIARGS